MREWKIHSKIHYNIYVYFSQVSIRVGQSNFTGLFLVSVWKKNYISINVCHCLLLLLVVVCVAVSTLK